MDWQALGAAGEVAGAAGVIFTLGYLAVQVRQNTKALGSVTTQAVTSTSADMGMRVLENPELLAAFQKMLRGEELLEETERFRMALLMRLMLRTMENQFYQNRQGFLTELWPGYRHMLVDFLQVPFIREWWPTQKDAFGPAYRDFVDRELAAAEGGSSELVTMAN